MSPYHTKKWRTSEVEGRSNKRERYSGGVEKRSPKLTILLFKEEHQQGHWPSRSKKAHCLLSAQQRSRHGSTPALTPSPHFWVGKTLRGQNTKEWISSAMEKANPDQSVLKPVKMSSWLTDSAQPEAENSWATGFFWRWGACGYSLQQLCESTERFWGPSSEGNYRVLLFSFLHSQPLPTANGRIIRASLTLSKETGRLFQKPEVWWQF